jgi:hypothetical protein
MPTRGIVDTLLRISTQMNHTMNPLFKPVACVLIGLLSSAVFAQSYPDGVVSPSAADIKLLLSGKSMLVKLANGGSWRLQYKDDGYMFLNTSNGLADSGKWKVEDGKLCSELRKVGNSCNEVRTKGDALYLKRDSGEIVQFVAQ